MGPHPTLTAAVGLARLRNRGDQVGEFTLPSAVTSPWWYYASVASMAASAYHGYRRNNSIGWGLAWGALGAVFPVITPTIALAEGFAKPIHGDSP